MGKIGRDGANDVASGALRGHGDPSMKDQAKGQPSVDSQLPPPPLPDEDLSTVDRERGNTSIDFDRTQASSQKPTDSTESSTPEIPGYRFVKRLGQGGMGIVFLAVDEKLNRPVAIKLMSEAANATERMRERFQLETQTVAQLRHPHIAQLYDADQVDGRPYFVMEYVEGQTLEEQVHSSPREPEEAVRLVKQLAETIEYCHARGILHRDLKPSNVLLDAEGTSKVADFGLAKTLHGDGSSTQTGEVVGTPGYMSPEQASGVVKDLGPACDVYGLGAILYKMLTGRAPFESPHPLQTVMMVISDEPVRPRSLQQRIPRDLETICLKCLEKEPARRYQSAKALFDDLDRFGSGRPIEARPTGPIERTFKWARRRPAAATLLLSLALAIPIIIGGLVWHSSRLTEQLRRTQRLANHGSDLTTWIITEHMNDLRRLRGSTEQQHQLVANVQTYLDKASDEVQADTKFLRRLALAYETLADVQGNPSYANQGFSSKAEENYLQAIRLYDQALTLDPADTATRRLRVQCQLKHSDILWQTAGMDEANEVLLQAAAAVKALPAQTDDEVINLRATTDHRIYEQHAGRGNYDEALQQLDRVADSANELSSDKKWQADKLHLLILVAEGRGRTHERMGNYEEATQHYQDMVDRSRELFEADATNPATQMRYTTGLIALADAQCFLRDFPTARDNYLEARRLRQELVELDRGNARYLEKYATSLARLASAYELLQESDSVFEPLREAAQIRRDLVDQEPEDRLRKRGLWIDLQSLGRAYLANKDLARAEESFNEHMQIARELTTGPVVEADDLTGLAQGHFHLGLIRFEELMLQLSDESVVFQESMPEYQAILKELDRSLAAFAQMEEISPLIQSQANFRSSVVQTKQAIEEMAQQLLSQGDADRSSDEGVE